MAELKEDILNPEETNSGFDAGEYGDETFLIESKGDYQGELPDFSFGGTNLAEPVPTEPKELEIDPESGVTKAEQIEIPEEGNVWDLFDEESQTQQDTIQDAAEEIPETQEFDSDDSQGLFDHETEIISSTESVIDNAEKSTEEEAEEPVSIDDDLKKLIEADLLKSSKKRKSVESDEVINQDDEVTEFIPVDQDEASDFIDLTSLEADRPSTYREKEVFPSLNPEPEDETLTGMHLSKHSKKPAVKPDDSGEVKERKRKKPLPWKIIRTASATALALAAVGIASFALMFAPGAPFELFKQNADTLAIVKQIPESKKKAELPKKEASAASATQAKDTAKVITDTSKEIAPIKKEIKPEPVIAKKEEKIKETTEKVQKPKAIPKKETKKPDIAYNEREVAPKDKPVIKQEPKPQQEKQVKDELYIVQIYTSPSKDDAEEWLSKLQQKNISDGFISTQKVRDQIWYRVRFGSFKTRDDARAAAIKYGFSQSWIDRVR